MSGVRLFRVSSLYRRSFVLASPLLAVVLAGCGNQYRPVVSATNPVGPAGQPAKYAMAVSSPSPTTPGLISYVDFSGDTVLTTPSIQANPSYLALNNSGTQFFTVNPTGTLAEYATNATTALTSDIKQTTLDPGYTPLNISPIALTGSNASIFIPELNTANPGNSVIAALSNTSGSPTLLQNVSVPATPTYVVGADNTSRIYALSSTGAATPGIASAIESSTNSGLTVSTSIPVGADPVYGVMTADDKRAFIVNKGSQSVNVINVVNNAPDTAAPVINIPTVTDANGNNLSANPVWADINPLTSELVVLSAGDGTHGGLLTIINIPLCNSGAQTTNPSCNAANPVDATGFGTIVKTVPVGVNPVMVSVLQDTYRPRAYVANQGNSTTAGSISVVDLTSGTVTATIPTGADDATNLSSTNAFGLHPNSISATVSIPTGKVYVTAGDSKYLTVIYTDTDTVITHVPLQGNGVRVLVTESRENN